MPELYIGKLLSEQPPCLTKHIVAAIESESKSIAGDFVPLIGAGVLRGYCKQAPLNQCEVVFTVPFEGKRPPETIHISHGQYLQMMADCPVREIDPA